MMILTETRNEITGVKSEAKLEISRSGLPCLWESGGGWTHTGGALIICDKNGSPKRAIYVRRHGDLCNGQHALIPIRIGDMLIEDDEHRGQHQIFVWKITNIEGEKAVLILKESFVYKGSREDKSYAPTHKEISCKSRYCDAISAAIDKANSYHCREAYYIQ